MRYIVYFSLSLILISCAKTFEEGYYDNGNLEYKVALIGGKRHGELKKYYKNGAVQYVSNWIKGVKEGKATLYHENGYVKLEETYQNGKPIGQVKEFDSLRNLIRVIYFNEGNQTKDSSFYHTGELESSVLIYNDTTLARYYFKSGQLDELSVRYRDKLIYAKKYDNEGKLLSSNIPVATVCKVDKGNIHITFEISYTNCSSCSFLIILHDDNGNEVFRGDFFKKMGEIILTNFSPTKSIIEGLIYEIDSLDQPQGYSPLSVEMPGSYL